MPYRGTVGHYDKRSTRLAEPMRSKIDSALRGLGCWEKPRGWRRAISYSVRAPAGINQASPMLRHASVFRIPATYDAGSLITLVAPADRQSLAGLNLYRVDPRINKRSERAMHSPLSDCCHNRCGTIWSPSDLDVLLACGP